MENAGDEMLTTRQKKHSVRSEHGERIMRLASSAPVAELRRRCMVSACIGAFFFGACAVAPARDQALASTRAPASAPQSPLLIAETTDAAAATATEKPPGQGDQAVKAP